jgi:hypothetical protein
MLHKPEHGWSRQAYQRTLGTEEIGRWAVELVMSGIGQLKGAIRPNQQVTVGRGDVDRPDVWPHLVLGVADDERCAAAESLSQGARVRGGAVLGNNRTRTLAPRIGGGIDRPGLAL